MSKKWTPLRLGTHVRIDGQVNGVVTEPLPDRAGQVYAIRTVHRVERIHAMRITVRPESLKGNSK